MNKKALSASKPIMIHGTPIYIRPYNVTRNGQEYVYYRARYPKPNGTYGSIQARTQEDCQNKIYHILNIHTFMPGYHHLPDTVASALPTWVKMRYQNGPRTSYRNFEAQAKIIVNSLGEFRIQDLTQECIQHFFDQMSIHGSSSSTIHSYASLLRLFLQEYADRKEIPFNPCDHLRLPVITTKEIIPLTPGELTELLNHLEPYGLKNFFALAAITAMRVGEVRALAWHNINSDNKTIAIIQQIETHYQDVTHRVKNNNPKTLQFPDAVFEILKDAKAYQEEQKRRAGDNYNNPEDLVFTTDTGEPLSYPRIAYLFHKAAVEIGRGQTRIHDLRHTMLSYVWEQTHDIDQVLQISRHKHPLSAKAYLHPTQKTQEEAAAIIAEVAKRLNVASDTMQSL